MEVRGVELRPRRVGAGRTWSAITRKTTLGSSAPAPPLVWAGEGLSVIGSAWVNWPLRVAALGALAWRRRWLQAAAFALAVATSEVLIGGLKALYARPRPLGSLVETTGYSFPSGHAVAGAVTAVGLVVVLLPPGRARGTWELRAAAFATVMSLSRAYLGAHWLSDVVAGGLLGTCLAIGWPAVLQEARARLRGRPTREVVA
jgi:undecaprenyl-diphosphatase